MMSEETFEAWKQTKETKEFFDFLAREEHAHRMLVGSGISGTEDSMEKIAKNYLMHIHKADVYNYILDVDYENILIEEEDNGQDSSIGTQAVNKA